MKGAPGNPGSPDPESDIVLVYYAAISSLIDLLFSTFFLASLSSCLLHFFTLQAGRFFCFVFCLLYRPFVSILFLVYFETLIEGITSQVERRLWFSHLHSSCSFLSSYLVWSIHIIPSFFFYQFRKKTTVNSITRNDHSSCIL